MPDDNKTLLEELREQRDTLRAADTAAIEAREAERTVFEARADKTEEDIQSFLDAERSYADAADKRSKELEVLKRRMKEQKTLEERREAAARAVANATHVTVGSEPLTYREDNARDTSYMADLFATLHPQYRDHLPHRATDTSTERIQRHAKEMSVELPKVEAERRRRSEKAVEKSVEKRLLSSLDNPFRSYDDSPYQVEQRTTPSRTDGFGGYFVQMVAA